ncbi:hypothetical protein ACP51_07970 [Clostridium botulinum]|nr:hypothetical protein ACP51_07970 [Clostridium botulinum]
MLRIIVNEKNIYISLINVYKSSFGYNNKYIVIKEEMVRMEFMSIGKFAKKVGINVVTLRRMKQKGEKR